MNEFMVGMLGALIGGLFVAGSIVAISFYELSNKNKMMKDFENNLLGAIKESKPKSKPAQVLPFKVPTPPKVN